MYIVYSKNNCIQCDATVQLLEDNSIPHEVVKLEGNKEALDYVKSLGFLAAPVVTGPNIKPFSGFRPELLLAL